MKNRINRNLLQALRAFHQEEKGVASIEFGLMLPIIVVFILGTYTVGLYQRYENTLHRETASIADILVNSPDGFTNADGEYAPLPIEEAVAMKADAALVLLGESFSPGVPENAAVGVSVSVYDSGMLDKNGEPIVYTAISGEECSNAEEEIPFGVEANNEKAPLVPKDKFVRLLRLRTCVKPSISPAGEKIALPAEINSQFTVMRSNND